MIAAPVPAMTRPVQSTSSLVLAGSEVPGVKMAIDSPIASTSAPPTNSRLRPKRSPSTPKLSSSTQTGTRKASEIQVSCAELVPRSCWNKPFSTAGLASAICARQTASTAAIRVPGRKT